MTQTKEHIYFIGIGGISMSGLAEILASRGHQVSGTDVKETAVTKHPTIWRGCGRWEFRW